MVIYAELLRVLNGSWADVEVAGVVFAAEVFPGGWSLTRAQVCRSNVVGDTNPSQSDYPPIKSRCECAVHLTCFKPM